VNVKKLLRLALFLPIAVYGQDNFVKSFVIKDNNDTVRGFINQKEWLSNPGSIEFKSDLTDQSSENFTPNDIKYFKIQDSQEYQRFKVSISMGTIDAEKATKDPEVVKEETVFLELLTKGEFLTLYRYADDIKSRLYILGDTLTRPDELVYKVKRYGDQNKVMMFKAYQNQLVNVATKAGKLTDKLKREITNASYNSESIMKIVDKINGVATTSGAAHSGFQKGKKPKLSFFVGAGFARSTDHHSSTILSKNAKQEVSTLPFFTGGVDLYFRPAVGRTFVRLDLSNLPLKTEIKANNGQTQFGRVEYTNNLSVQALSFALNAMYNFYKTEKLKFYGGAGLVVNKVLSQKSTLVTVNPSTPEAAVTRKNFLRVIEPFTTINLRVGARIGKHADIAICYLPKTNNNLRIDTNGGTAFTGKIESIKLGVNYTF